MCHLGTDATGALKTEDSSSGGLGFASRSPFGPLGTTKKNKEARRLVPSPNLCMAKKGSVVLNIPTLH